MRLQEYTITWPADSLVDTMNFLTLRLISFTLMNFSWRQFGGELIGVIALHFLKPHNALPVQRDVTLSAVLSAARSSD